MRITTVLLIAAVAVYLYFESSATITETKPQVVETTATAPPHAIAITPLSQGKMTDRWKTGPNAQTNLAEKTDRWKTGPNAQTGLTEKK